MAVAGKMGREMAPRLSGAAVLLIIVVPLCMYTCALFVGIQLGRALERRPDSINISIRGVVQHFAKELWGIERRGRDSVGDERVVRFVPADPVITRSPPTPQKHTHSRPGIDLEIQDSSTSPKARSYSRNHTSPRGVISVGPWGGSGGHPFYMHGRSAPRLHSIILYHSSVIHSLACEYSSHAGDGGNRVAGPWGLPHSYGSRGVRATMELSAGEHVTAVEGTIGNFANVPGAVITSLTLRSNMGRTYGPYGSRKSGAGARFSVPAADGSCIVGFWGRSGWLLDAIGVYMRPCSNRTYIQGSRRQGSIKAASSDALESEFRSA